MKLNDILTIEQKANWVEIQTNRLSSKAFCIEENNKKFFLKIEQLSNSWSVSSEYLKVIALEDPYVIKYHIVEESNFRDFGFDNSLITLTDYLPQRIFLSDFFSHSNFKTQLEICFRFLGSIHAIHKKGILHRDISSPNFLVFEKFKQFFPIITDFNFFVPLEHDEIFISPEYLAPEVKGYLDYKVKSEIWAIGALIFYFCTNSFPFGSRIDGFSHDEIKSNVLNQKIDSKINIIPEVFQKIIKLCLEKNIDERPESLEIIIKILKKEIGWKSHFIV
jgi:serine/threonine protein kinase